ncbi:FkbM family methyltransferase [Paraburkholderia piptadeniae]|nr:FkbM family methyltransferase [Paraburkholderia piptadeniae]
MNPMSGIGVAKDPIIRRPITVGEKSYQIAGDNGYLTAMGEHFEPTTIRTLRALCDDGAHAIDVGANIGLTALGLSQYCDKVAAVEPVPRTFDYLRRNTEATPNISIFKHALGNSEGIVRMQGYNDFLAGSFIADTYQVNNDNHFLEAVPIKRLDDCFASTGLGRLDLMKVDVEGFELEVFEGGRQVIGDLKPLAFLEMNHWCLNVFRRISIPEFRERLLAVFPFVFAMDGENYLDYGDDANVHNINHGHIIEHRFSNLVAGFDRDEIIARLETLRSPVIEQEAPQATTLDAMHLEIDSLRRDVADLQMRLNASTATVEAIQTSTSWKITAPIRSLVGAFKK